MNYGCVKKGRIAIGLLFRKYRNYAAVTKYDGTDKTVVIPAAYENLPVTKIAGKAFCGNHFVTDVTVPDTLEAIGRSAFEDCRNLRRISTRTGLERDGPECSRMPKSLCKVANRAFFGAGLVDVVFAAPKLLLGGSAFEDCQKLENVVMAARTTLEMGHRIFAESTLSCFYGEYATAPMLPDFGFAHCVELTTVWVNTRRLGFFCFDGCSRLKELKTGGRLEQMELGALNGCSRLDSREIVPNASPEPKPLPLELKRKFLISCLQWQLTQLADLRSKSGKAMPAPKPALEPEPAFCDGADSLLHLCYESMPPAPNHLPRQFCGKVLTAAGDFYFSPRTEDMPGCSMLRCSLPAGRGIARLLTQVSKIGCLLGVRGRWSGRWFLVWDMYPVFSGFFDQQDGPTGFFREVLERLSSPIPASDSWAGTAEPVVLQQPREMELFLELCRDCTPQWVHRAYQRNQAAARDSDERKHAQRAMSLLVSISWTPKQLRLPPMAEAETMLDQAFYGLREVKLRVLETLSQIRRTGKLPKWGILLAGPAGIGKTSIAKAIAQILGFPMIQLDFSSIGKDADSICGTSRIYSNARPGLILEQMYHNRSSTAVLLANEIDKAATVGGAAMNTLLTVLDKTGFYENFLEEAIPTDHLFCVATCNDLRELSAPLLDRFQVIELPGYTYEEKQAIWRGHSLPMAMEQAAVGAEELTVTPEAEALLLREYALEPGVRDLEKIAQRLVGNYCRLAEASRSGSYAYTPDRVRKLLGPGRRQLQAFLSCPGKVQGALLLRGGVEFFLLEADISPGSGKFHVLGSLDEAQKSYCQAAYHCLRGSCGIDLSHLDVTVFLPTELPPGSENQVGLACYAAIYSRLTGVNLANRGICFLGGCDLSGSLYLPPADMGVLLRVIRDAGITTLYAPLGTVGRLDPCPTQGISVTIVEAPDASTLLSLAARSV